MGTRASDPDQRNLLDAAIAFEDLVGDARQGPAHPVGIDYDGHGDAFG
jgi:hypothetical protein